MNIPPIQFIFEMPPKVLLFFVVSTTISLLLILAESVVTYNIGRYGTIGFHIPEFKHLKLIAINLAVFYALGSVFGYFTQMLTYIN